MASVTSMKTTKERAVEIINNLPDDSTFDNIILELRVARGIQKGLEDVRMGRVISSEEMEKRVNSWPE